MPDELPSVTQRLLVGLPSAGALLVLVAAVSFTGYLVDRYVRGLVGNPVELFVGSGSVFLVPGLVLISLWRFFLGTAPHARETRAEAICQFTYLIGLSAGLVGGFFLIGVPTKAGGGIQAVLLSYVGPRSDFFSFPLYGVHLGGACLTFYPTLFGLFPTSLYDLELAGWIRGLFAVWARHPMLGFRFLCRSPPQP